MLLPRAEIVNVSLTVRIYSSACGFHTQYVVEHLIEVVVGERSIKGLLEAPRLAKVVHVTRAVVGHSTAPLASSTAKKGPLVLRPTVSPRPLHKTCVKYFLQFLHSFVHYIGLTPKLNPRSVPDFRRNAFFPYI